MDIELENGSYVGEKERSIGSWENTNNSEDGETEVRLKDFIFCSIVMCGMCGCLACIWAHECVCMLASGGLRDQCWESSVSLIHCSALPPSTLSSFIG